MTLPRTPALATDCVVFDPCVLLIRRGHEPCAGKHALPGGFVKIEETVMSACRRVCVPGSRSRSAKLLWFEVTWHPTAEWLARQITEAFPWTWAPAYLVRDNDRAYGHVFTSRVRAMGIRDRPISPGSPWQNGCAERLIGTLRRECLDQILIFGEAHLRRVLSAYAAYYNQARTHLALGKDAPLHRAVQRSGAIATIPILAGLHHQYVRI